MSQLKQTDENMQELVEIELDNELSEFHIDNEKETIYNDLIVNSQKKFRITKFEKAKIIGIRATQLSSGISTILSSDDLKKINVKNTLEIAEEEFRQGKIPIIIKRKYANGKKKYIQFNSENFCNLDL